ncbi:MlaD family protein [Novosphingobium lentum]|uniref:MlaD family protein n=1 Tax=Novosphingobium lentum TaxID=145287 RepID=UPI00082A7098|nr:MlaD family protein [Novosphingobium lentum]
METRANHIWVGAVTLILMAGLAALVIWIARLNQGEQNAYDIFFKQSVDGLAKGSEVAFSGVPAGQVKEIELWPKDPEFVRVRIKVDEKIPILQGTTATLQGSFTGVSTIQLEGAVKGAPPIAEPGPDGVPVIPTKRGGLGELLSNAPLLLERLATLTERMTLLLSDKNQKSLEDILAHTDKMTGDLAQATPDVKRTLAELQSTLRQANYTLASFQKLAGSADDMINKEGNGLAAQLSTTLKSAQAAADELKATLGDARPAARQLNDRTLPAAEAAIRDLQATTRSLRAVTDKINDRGVGGLVGGPKLPDYKP